MIAPREKTLRGHADDTCTDCLMNNLISFPSRWGFDQQYNSIMYMEGGMCNSFIFPFSQLPKPKWCFGVKLHTKLIKETSMVLGLNFFKRVKAVVLKN